MFVCLQVFKTINYVFQIERYFFSIDFSFSSVSKKDRFRKYPEADLTLALTDIGLSNALDHILNDEQWVDDASGLIPHCLAVLRTCHTLTERLANLAMRPMGMRGSTDRLIEAAKRVPFRVDDVG